MAKDGKDFEKELVGACKQLKAWSLNSNDPVPCCDRIMSIPVRVGGLVLGLAALVEAKECRDESFDLTRISPNERRNLQSFSQSGGVTAVLIKVVSSQPRYFACTWSDWTELEHGIGFDPDHDKSTGRRKAGTASLSLRDGERPFTMIELPKVVRPNSLGRTFDLTPLLPVGVALA